MRTSSLLQRKINDLGDVHGMPQQRQGVKRPRRFGPQLIAHFPQSLGELVDEQRHFAVSEFAVDPARTPRVA